MIILIYRNIELGLPISVSIPKGFLSPYFV